MKQETQDKVQGYTPGPWACCDVDHGEYEISARSGHSLVGIVSHHNARSDADARLIAAAPELLEALRDLIEDYEGHISVDPQDMADDELFYREHYPAWFAARTAIAKATQGGRS